ncbi:MAG: DnaJ domain-containing protein [Thaumarchaeota archaeon]|nr:DnaJ domain-containing protein [Nitrososphaerota archaeon]MDE0267272.1 DnaJ domain-containing protein [Nitrososphaerota archaeon]MDE0526607.1 DnaJ domain-containing protein [Nitrososphaerota archaeon]
MENHHAVLGVGRGADRNEIREAFRRRALECHPDVGGGGGDGSEFMAARRAYEALVNPAMGGEDEAAGLHAEMRRAGKWCADPSTFGTADFGESTFEKYGGSVRVAGRLRAGRLRFGGRITVYGDVSSPPWGGPHGTVLRGDGGVDIRGNAINGAKVRGRDVFAVDVFGLRRVERDKVRVGVSWDASLHARITADGGNAVLRNCTGPARIRGDIVDVWDVRDGCVLEGRRVVVRGSTVTHDCVIRVSESLSFETDQMLGLSDNCTVSWAGGEVKLGRLKTYRTGRLPGLGGTSGTMVGGGFVMTVQMLQHAAARRGWNPFARG